MSKAIPWQFYNKEWGKPFRDELLVMFENLQLGVREAILWWVACYVWDFTIRSEWSHSMTIYNKEWAKPFRDELLVMFGSKQGMFAKFQELPMYAESTTHHHLGKEEKATLLILLTIIILVGREAACFVLWFMKGRKKKYYLLLFGFCIKMVGFRRTWLSMI